jgi:phage N-6-adenine-methyltransferase
MVDKALFSSSTTEWETPDILYNELNKEFHFVMDVAATRENSKCDFCFTEKEDGLKQAWNICSDPIAQNVMTYPGRVFCNPPYGREVGKWVAKADQEFRSGNAELIVMLLPSRTDVKWFHQYIYNKPNVTIRFIKGRLTFKGAKHPAPFPSMLVIWE